MKGKYKAAIALLLLLILLPLTLLMTLAQWVPTLAGIWLPVGTRIAFEESPKLTRHALVIPNLRYLVEDCEIAGVENATLSHPSRWNLDIGALELNTVCLSKIPQSAPSTVAPKTRHSGSRCCLIPGSLSAVLPCLPGNSGKGNCMPH